MGARPPRLPARRIRVIPRREFTFHTDDPGGAPRTKIVLRQGIPAKGWTGGQVIVRVHDWEFGNADVAVEVHSVSYSADDPSLIFGSATSVNLVPCGIVAFNEEDVAPGTLRTAQLGTDESRPIGPFLQVLLRVDVHADVPIRIAISVDLAGHYAPPRFDPLLLEPSAAYLPGGYSDLGNPDVWRASSGADVTAADDAARTELAGCPQFDYSAAAGEVHLSNGVAFSSWAGGASQDRQFVARVDLADVSTSDPTNIWLNCAAISDSGSFMGLHFRKSGSSYYAYYYEWDTQARIAEVEITPLLVNGHGSLVVQARRQSNLLSIKIGGSAWVYGAAPIGAIASTAGTLRIGYRGDMIVRAVLAFPYVLQDRDTDRVAEWAGRFF